MKVLNEKNRPVQTAWLIKNLLYLVLAQAFFITLVYFFNRSMHGIGAVLVVVTVFTGIISIVRFVTIILMKINFQYEFNEKNIFLRQGIISKSEKHTFYGRIQNIGLFQDFIDKFIGTASLVIETASDSGGANIANKTNANESRGVYFGEFGFYSNCILIPGLLYADALDFKQFIMEQIKTNPIDDAQSGL